MTDNYINADGPAKNLLMMTHSIAPGLRTSFCSPMRRTTIGDDSDGHNRQARKSCTVEAAIQGEKAESILDSMRSYQEIGEYSPLAGRRLFSPPGDIKLECPASNAPDAELAYWFPLDSIAIVIFIDAPLDNSGQTERGSEAV